MCNPPIAPLPPAIADYLARFDLMALALTRDNRVIATRNQAGAAAAWWCQAKDAGRSLRWVQQHGSRDVVYARAASTSRSPSTPCSFFVPPPLLPASTLGCDKAGRKGLMSAPGGRARITPRRGSGFDPIAVLGNARPLQRSKWPERYARSPDIVIPSSWMRRAE
jgi:hypothetical protein